MPTSSPRNRTRALLPLAAAMVVGGCAVEIPMRPSMTEQQLADNLTSIRESPKTRAEVHALLGEPWMRSDAWRVELFRATGKQRKVLLVFAPYPVPVPAPSSKLEAYTLVAYNEAGAVEAIDATFVDPGGARPADRWTFELRAGDFTFVHFGPAIDALAVSQQRFLRDYVPAAGTTCTVLVACAPGACYERVQLDRGPERTWPLVAPLLQLQDADRAPAGEAPASRPAADAAATPQPVAGGAGRGGAMAPLAVGAGAHELRFTSRWIQGELGATVDCRAPALLYAVERATTTRMLSMREQLFAGLRMYAAQGTVEVLPQLPGELETQRVLLNVDGQWIVPADAAN